MPRINPIEAETASTAEQELLDRIKAQYGRATNMKRTLAHDPTALEALLTWYPLHDAVLPLLGERLVHLFCYAISTKSDCVVCSTYFRRVLIEAGEDPQHFQLDPREAVVVAFGSQVAQDANHVSDELYQQLSEYFSPPQIVTLTAFAALMIATNVFNNALAVDLDDYLVPYQADQAIA